jgi:exonuclease VII small subunit
MFENKTTLQLCIARNALKKERHINRLESGDATLEDATEEGYQIAIDMFQAEIDKREAAAYLPLHEEQVGTIIDEEV